MLSDFPKLPSIPVWLFFISTSLFPQLLSSQNVGIGTSSPQARLHVSGPTASIQVDNGPLVLYNPGLDRFTQLSVTEPFTFLQSNYPNGVFFFRPGNGGLRDILLNGNGISIVSRGPVDALSAAEVPLDIRNNGEGIRLNGITPYITLLDGGVQRGYLQAWTDGIALASTGHDVGLWTNGVKRMAIKPNGALEINGSSGTAGQVLTSNGPGTPSAWSSPYNALYNSFRFITLSQTGFTSTNDNVWRDIPGLSSTFTFTGNTYVDVASNISFISNFCIGCDNPIVECRLLVNANSFSLIKDRTGGPDLKTKSLTTGFTLPAGTHTVKWQIRCTDGSQVTVLNSDSRALYLTFMRIWTAAQ